MGRLRGSRRTAGGDGEAAPARRESLSAAPGLGPPEGGGATRRAALLGILALGGCGFSPALRPGGRGRFAIAAPPTRAGLVLSRRLEDRLGAPGADAPYAIAVAFEIDPEVAAVDPAQVTTRVRLEVDARYAVTQVATGGTVASGTASAFASYDATGTTVAEGAAARDAEDRLMSLLADRIAARLLAANLP